MTERSDVIVPGGIRGRARANMFLWIGVALLVLVMQAKEGLSRGLPTVVRGGGPVRSSETKANSTDPPTCPTISLSETSLMVRIDRLRGPAMTLASGIRTDCTNSDGTEYDPVYTDFSEGRVVVYRNQRYVQVAPGVVVGSLACGEQLECRHSLRYDTRYFGDLWYQFSGDDCGYDYRTFIQWGYGQVGTGFTCENPGNLLFTLVCVECQDPSFDWDLAYNMSGELLERPETSTRTFNYVMIITAVSVVGCVVLVAIVGVIIRGRRRARIDRDVVAMMERRGGTRPDAQNKPPELFEVGDAEEDESGCVEMAVIGEDYKGPIVVKYDTLISEEDVDAGCRVGDDGSQPQLSGDMSSSINASKASTNWTLTQIAVIDNEVEELNTEEGNTELVVTEVDDEDQSVAEEQRVVGSGNDGSPATLSQSQT